MRRITEIVCTYWCPSCDKDLVKIWREKPWFGDYAKRCTCGRNLWPQIARDYSRDELSYQEARHGKK